MAGNRLVELLRFFKSARHLWGRCPDCQRIFRLSDVAISFGSEPPHDWLRRLQRQQAVLDDREAALEGLSDDLSRRGDDVLKREAEVRMNAKRLEQTARALAKDMLRSDKTVRAAIKEARLQAVQRSRSTLLGKLFERLGPFFQQFGHDPRDMRAIMDPIDYVVFNGLTVRRQVDHITFVEVKSGLGRTSSCQRSIAETIRRGDFDVETWQIGERDLPLTHQLLKESSSRAE